MKCEAVLLRNENVFVLVSVQHVAPHRAKKITVTYNLVAGEADDESTSRLSGSGVYVQEWPLQFIDLFRRKGTRRYLVVVHAARYPLGEQGFPVERWTPLRFLDENATNS